MADHPLVGGRFDSTTQDPYSFLYAAGDDATAVAETLLRDLPFDERGGRLLARRQLAGRCIGWMRTTQNLMLVSLRSGRDLAAIGQDGWLTAGPAAAYGMTRRWAAAIRVWDTEAAGMVWRPRLDPDGLAYVFFGDRCPAAAFMEQRGDAPLPPEDRELASSAGRRYIERLLEEYRVAVV
ncbi:MAG: RES family NAD+ phosphorylase [Chloroflexi bacterium]|nr:RES family NAD+ phosphorylase [Chloroflexota bacterium]